ncbi:MAG: hypothetical protein ACI8TF_003046, partial [Paracoccaceae bacterium]
YFSQKPGQARADRFFCARSIGRDLQAPREQVFLQDLIGRAINHYLGQQRHTPLYLIHLVQERSS